MVKYILICTPNIINCAHEIINCAHEIINCAHEIINCAHEIINCAHEIIICAHEIINCGHEIINCAHEIINCAHEIIICAHEIIICAHSLLFRAHSLLFRAHSLLFRAHSLLFRAHSLLCWAYRLKYILPCRLRGSVVSYIRRYTTNECVKHWSEANGKIQRSTSEASKLWKKKVLSLKITLTWLGSNQQLNDQKSSLLPLDHRRKGTLLPPEQYCREAILYRYKTAGGQECTGILLPPRNKTAPHKSNSK